MSETDFFSPRSDFPLKVMRNFHQTEIKMHSHEFEELVIIESGRGIHITDKYKFTVNAGDVFLIRRGGSHAYKKTENLFITNILFRLRELPVPEKELRKLSGYHALFKLEPEFRKRDKFTSHLTLSRKELFYISKLVGSLSNELMDMNQGYEFMALAHFMEIIGFLARAYSGMNSSAHTPVMQLGELISSMEKDFKKEMDIKNMCQKAGMSKSTFFRFFKKATGLSPIEYLLKVRITHAAEMLQSGLASVKEASSNCGFMDSNYFSRQFHKIMGISPREYSKKKAGVLKRF